MSEDFNTRRLPLLLKTAGPLVEATLGQERARDFGARVSARVQTLLPRAPRFEQRINAALFSIGVPALGMYLVLRDELGLPRDEALSLLERILEGTSRKRLGGSRLRRGALNLMLRTGAVRKRFLKMFTAAHEANGFRFEAVDDPEALMAFDVKECALVKYMRSEGALELVPLFCHLDDVMMDYVEGLELRREGTIGRGAERCDFRYVRKG